MSDDHVLNDDNNDKSLNDDRPLLQGVKYRIEMLRKFESRIKGEKKCYQKIF